MWQNWERGKVKSLVDGLDKSSLIRGLQDDEDLTKGTNNTNDKQINAMCFFLISRKKLKVIYD